MLELCRKSFLSIDLTDNSFQFCACAPATRPLFTSDPSLVETKWWTRVWKTIGMNGCVGQKKYPTRRSEMSSTTEHLQSQREQQ